MAKIRGNAYYLARLEREHPNIFADWKAGKYSTARQALIAAGLRKAPSQLDALKTAWRKSSRRDQIAFLRSIGASIASPTAPIVDGQRRLLPATAARIETIFTKRAIKMGDAMDEMGFKRLNTSLGNALANRPTRLKPDMVRALEKWLEDNQKV